MARYLVTRAPGTYIDFIGRLVPPGEAIEVPDDYPASVTWVGLDPVAEKNVQAQLDERERRASLSPEDLEKENRQRRAAYEKQRRIAELRGSQAAAAEYRAKFAAQAEAAQAAKDVAALDKHQEKIGQTLSELGESGGRAEPVASTEQASHVGAGGVTVRKRASDTKV